MCGLTGIYAFNEAGRFNLINLQRSIDRLEHRGPDAQGSYFDEKVGLGHRRLAVIDTSREADQPLSDHTGRYLILFNGEIYNFKLLRAELENRYQVQFRTKSDTEVLLYCYIHYRGNCLKKLNGFFSFAVYDKTEKSLFIARDRFGIKPLYYFSDNDKFLFASEMRSIMAFGIEREINRKSLSLFFQLNYIPAPYSILNGVYKLLPGHYIKLTRNEVEIRKYYEVSADNPAPPDSFKEQKQTLLEKLDDSVRQRLVADVPLGVFLSGGVDSSLITALASRHKEELETFSVGYPGQTFFDETPYARQVAGHFGTRHHVFNITNSDLYHHLDEILDHIDEPFADSSALPVYLLSKYTRKHVTVALSGDGADEIFAGYNKHMAFYRSIQKNLTNSILKSGHPLFRLLPRSRNNPLFNKFRQLERYARGLRFDISARYWFWASLMTPEDQERLFSLEEYEKNELIDYRKKLTAGLTEPPDMNTLLKKDLEFILPNDMLYKVDLMSMAHGLEVRVPFLDHHLVEYAFSLPVQSKIQRGMKKRILREILHDLIPGKLHKRPKHGFEVPLLNWFSNELRSTIENDLLNRNFIEDQGIFNVREVEQLKKKLFSGSPGDTHAHVWAMIVFQSWWKKHFS